MAGMTKVLVYWTEENNWSILTPTALRDDANPGQRTYAKYQGKWFPSLVVAKDDQKAIDKVEKSFSIFINNCLQEESPQDVEKCIVKYIQTGKIVPEAVEKSVLPPNPSTSSLTTECSATIVPSGKIVPEAVEKSVLPPNPSTSSLTTECSATIVPCGKIVPEAVEKSVLPPNPSTSSLTTEGSPTIVPYLKIGNTSFDGSDSPAHSSMESKSERRIRKLEEDYRYLKRKIRKMEELMQDQKTRNTGELNIEQERKITKMEELMQDEKTRKTGELNIEQDNKSKKKEEGELDIDLTTDLTTSNEKFEIKRLNELRNDKEKLKYLVSCFFTEEELKTHSRTGKRSHKSDGPTSRPPLDVKTYNELADAVTKYTSYDIPTFIKKLENIQKMLRR